MVLPTEIIPCKRCCSNHKENHTRLSIKSTNEAFNNGVDGAVFMMKKTIKRIKNHKAEKRFEGIDLCDLDIDAGIGAIYFQADESAGSIWRLLWASAENKINKRRLINYDRSEVKTKIHQYRAEQGLEEDWEEGCDFENAQAKSHAIISVEEALIHATKLSTKKATTVMTHLVSKLAKSKYFHEESILTENRKCMNALMRGMIEHASMCIKELKGEGKSGKQSDHAIKLLTGVAGLFIPPSEQHSTIKCVKLLEMNHRSKYVTVGMENRKRLDEYFTFEGDIVIGEMVQCRGGFGTLKDINAADDSITISLHPWKADAIYCPKSSARMVRYEPNLLDWERATRKDTVPQQWIDAIESFLLKHNHPSPNAKDQICKRHPKYPRQKIYAPVIYRYETWDQLWSEFKIEHPAIAAHIQNPNQPNECPSRLRFHAPWNMMKGTDSSCLCINCEGTNAVKCGAKAAMAIIMTMTIVAGNDDTTPADERALAKLLKIYKILETPSKYAMCVECLPCLTSGELEDAMFKCVNGSCERCGFDKLWKHGVRKRIFRREYDEAKHEWIDVLEQSSVLAMEAWLEIIEWRDY